MPALLQYLLHAGTDQPLTNTNVQFQAEPLLGIPQIQTPTHGESTRVDNASHFSEHRSHSSYTGIDNGEQNAALPGKSYNKVCFYRYHYGLCSADPVSPNRDTSKKPCPYLHPSGSSIENYPVQTGPRWWHRKACNRPECPLNDRSPKKSSKDVAGADAAATEGLETEDSPSRQSKKRKRKQQGTDNEAHAIKISKTSSEQGPSTAPRSTPTCFFWYHGGCNRRVDTHGRPCRLLHALTDPRAMVQPPVGYVHRKPCKLPWCPGDHVNRDRQGAVGLQDMPSRKKQKYDQQRRDRDGEAFSGARLRQVQFAKRGEEGLHYGGSDTEETKGDDQDKGKTE
ncbi:hypothetical protein H2203_006798 [Taxawa tesnikishii (nom. ined.)]|nr:hypothetical protein H2203_006798 [Dothideales sp. JES 119]